MKYQIQIPSELKRRDNRPIILAHRGCRAQAPENSMTAFRLALEQGADVIETDLRITQDREGTIMPRECWEKVTASLIC